MEREKSIAINDRAIDNLGFVKMEALNFKHDAFLKEGGFYTASIIMTNSTN